MLVYKPGKKGNQIVIVANHLSGRFTTDQKEALARHCAKTLGVNYKFNKLGSRCTITFDAPIVQDKFLKDFSEFLVKIS